MSENVISWNIQNFVTVVLMAAIVLIVVMGGAKLLRGKMGTSSVPEGSTNA